MYFLKAIHAICNAGILRIVHVFLILKNVGSSAETTRMLEI